MKAPRKCSSLLLAFFTLSAASVHAQSADTEPVAAASSIGRYVVRTIPPTEGHIVRSATYTPSGKVLVSYRTAANADSRQINLAVMDDDGSKARTFFSQALPVREKDNGVRFMVFDDNRRIFLGDFIIECTPSIDVCDQSMLHPVEYPADVAGGDHISHRWSEIIVAPDNRHVAWTTLLANYSAVVFLGELRKNGASYVIANSKIISTLDPFKKDPKHPDGVIPQPIRNGEVKQFVDGGAAISLVGAIKRDLPDSVVLHLASGEMEAITDTPGYTETTIFSPDGRLGMTMTTRFSKTTDPAILGLIPRPYPASLNMGLSMFAYTYAVTGVRAARSGNVGPALIEIQPSKTRDDYLGINLNTHDEWVFHSPMSWHPSSKKALWMEGLRGGGARRIQVVELPDYQPGPAVAAKSTPEAMSYASSDLSIVPGLVKKSRDIDVKVYGRTSGHIEYRRTAATIEKTYVSFSDDGKTVYSGREAMQVNPRSNSTYTANIRLTGATPGIMDLKITFGPLNSDRPASIIFENDASGKPLTHGYVEFAGQRLTADTLIP